MRSTVTDEVIRNHSALYASAPFHCSTPFCGLPRAYLRVGYAVAALIAAH
ncbi:MAG TPA: hypothetical protein VER26_09330 [Xanthobacteraceae bacterium]|nr:hypothetical protein [Xanthobacteraceae bacterium]